jgi:dextranase
MAAMPYLAVYAASLEFWREHADWALYDEQGEALSFVDFLGLMDPTAGRPWSIHMLNECKKVLAALPFDGLHVDQYGEHFGDEDGKPKKVFDADGEVVDIPKAFSQFLHSLGAAHPAAPVTFNAVGNWPIAALAAAPQDFVYIEIWPPSTSYFDLVEIVLNARRLSRDKAVIIALYLPASRIANIRLADALIFSCGGARIELGDKERLLSDPYFPKHQALSPELKAVLRRYYDFAVRYQELFGPAVRSVPEPPLLEEPSLLVSEGIWHAVRQSPGRLTLCLVNMCGVIEPRWDKDHSEPQAQINGRLTLFSDQLIRQVLWATPDSLDPNLRSINWQVVENRIEVNLPELIYWAILVFELDEEMGTQ